MKPKGKLYLIPVPLGEGALATIPSYVIERLHQLRYLVAERAKSARHFIKSTHPKLALQELNISELNKRTRPEEVQQLLAPALAGEDMGLLSEAGCPAVADPGAQLVALAHRKGIQVVPLVGPSSILLALMASGMNGQQFCFHGYLPPKRPELASALKRLEQAALRHQQTQLFIETPYRNKGLIEQALQVLSPKTRFCIAADLTLPTEYVQTLRISEWRKAKLPDLHKRPAIFLIGS
ncbi:MAG: SAM-dependent methyltransferase [Bacteroidota bacterium]